MDEIKFLIADNDKILRKTLVRFLATFPLNLKFYEASNGVEVMEMLRNFQIGIVLLDIQMPVMGGVDCLKLIKKDFPATKVIVLTQFSEPALVAHLLQIGLDGFLLKQCDPEELTHAIAQVIQYGQYYSESVQEIIKTHLNSNNHQLAQLDLSPREFQVAILLKEGKTNKQIAKDLGLTLRTIESYRKALMKKTKCKNVAELVKFLFKTGMVA